MKRIILAALVGGMVSGPAWGQETPEGYSATDLYRACVEVVKWSDGLPHDIDQVTYCNTTIHAYRYGFANGAITMGNYHTIDPKEFMQKTWGCSPPLNNGSFIRIFVQGMKAHPELFSGIYPTAMRVIFSKKFPCNKQNNLNVP